MFELKSQFYSEGDVENKFKKNVNNTECCLQARKRPKICFDWKLKNNQTVKRKNLWKILMNYFLPNLIGGISFFIIFYLSSFLPCDSSNLLTLIFRKAFLTIFDSGFYSFMFYHLLFPYIFKKIKDKRNRNFLNILMLCNFMIPFPTFQYLVINGYLTNNLLMNLTVFFLANLNIFIICKLDKIKFAEIRNYFCIYFLLVSFLIFNHYFIKYELILKLTNNFAKENPLLFRICLFVYFNLYRRLIYFLMIKYFIFCKTEKFYGGTFGMKMLFTFFLSDLMISLLIPIIIDYNDNIDDQLKIIFNIVLFTYQLVIIYSKQNFVWEFIKKIIFYSFNIEENAKNSKNKAKEKVANLTIALLNEMLPVFYIKIFQMQSTKRFLADNKIMRTLSDSCFGFSSKLHIKLDPLILLIMINILIFITYYFATNRKMKVITKNIHSSLINRVLYAIMTYFFFEVLIQFYLFIFLSDKDETRL